MASMKADILLDFPDDGRTRKSPRLLDLKYLLVEKPSLDSFRHHTTVTLRPDIQEQEAAPEAVFKFEGGGDGLLLLVVVVVVVVGVGGVVVVVVLVVAVVVAAVVVIVIGVE